MSVGDAQELRAASAGPAHDVSGTAPSQSEICGLAREGGKVERMDVPTVHRRVLRRSEDARLLFSSVGMLNNTFWD